MPGSVLPAPPFGHFLGRQGIRPYSYGKNPDRQTDKGFAGSILLLGGFRRDICVVS